MDAKAQKTIELAERLIEARLLVADLQARLRAHISDEPDPPAMRSPATVETRLLAFVVEKSPKLVTPSTAAEQLDIPLGTVHAAFARLFDKGMLSRVSHGCYAVPNFIPGRT